MSKLEKNIFHENTFTLKYFFINLLIFYYVVVKLLSTIYCNAIFE
jgi:hypothetical protein